MKINKTILEGHWKEVKGLITKKWGKITDDELTQMTGKYTKYTELEAILQKKYGYSQEKARKEIEEFLGKINLKK